MPRWDAVWAIYRESGVALAISLLGGVFAGSILGTEGMIDAFERYPGLLLLLPAFLATRGNVYGALGARIASGLHQGLIEPRLSRDPRLSAAVLASFVNGIGISVFVGAFSWALLAGLPGREPAAFGHLVGITLVAGLLTSFVLIFGLLVLIFGGFKRGYDPDNLIGPIVTTLGDVFGVIFLYTAVLVVGVIPA